MSGYQVITNRFRHRADILARRLITLAGIGIVLSIGAIFVFISLEVYPLFVPARGELLEEFADDPAERPLLIATDEYRENLLLLRRSGRVSVIPTGGTLPASEFDASGGIEVVAAARDPGSAEVALVLSSGEIRVWRMAFEAEFVGDERRVQLEAREIFRHAAIEEGFAPRKIVYRGDGSERRLVVWDPGRGLRLLTRSERETPSGEAKVAEELTDLGDVRDVRVTAMALSSDGRRLFVGDAEGWLRRWELDRDREPVESVRAARQGRAITAVAFLIGDRTLVVGDSGGGVRGWLRVRESGAPDGWRTTAVHVLDSHEGPIRAIAPSERGKSFLTGDERGTVRLHHSTSAGTLLRFEGRGRSVAALAFAPKEDGAVAVDGSGQVRHWTIENPHPEITWQTLFGRVWYEGYPEPDFVWQSTGGTDDFEPKLSLTPLAFGTLKGTSYALLFAVPIAILAALYTSQFLRPDLRTFVKSTIEIMAALPSVVLGFLAGLWLAPLVAGFVPGLLLAFLLVPILLIVSSVVWASLPETARLRLPGGSEIVLLVPLVALGIWLSLVLGESIERALFEGDFPHWLYRSAGERYDQRNSLVVGFAMGFAVIPIIFTIAEDALSNVPKRLISASLALGATTWQTAVRVVLPTASPGIFSATMIGFGRAVGETMIVLMATGNTPLMDLSIFNGFRALSANIAVEIPEAPFGGTLYRVLFLAALLLFLATFLLNTLAEVVRMRLRERYSRL